MNLELAQIVQWTAGKLCGGDDFGAATGYSIDSRTLKSGDLFFAVRGDRFDGHDFVAAAFEQGACAAVAAESKILGLSAVAKRRPLIVVDDPLLALQRLAAAVRRYWGKRVVAITGSAGKTTTKDAVATVLAARYNVLKSQGNLNNHLGLPLQLLKLEPAHEVAVMEMGMSNAGEIAALAKIASPEWGVVTNVGSAHAENFAEGVAGIARAKYELVASLPAHGVAFLNCDDVYVGQFGRDFHGKAVYFGRGACADPRADAVEELGAEGLRIRVRAGSSEAEFKLRLLGRHNVANALAAIAVGVEADIPLDECARALETLEPGDKRGQVLQWRGATIINDCYNSNPAALRAMIQTLAAMPSRRRILVAGEMLELGPEAAALHNACGKAAGSAGIDMVVGVRGDAAQIVEGARQSGAQSLFLDTPQQAGAWLRENLKEGDVALLKASRGVRLERALAEMDEDDT